MLRITWLLLLVGLAIPAWAQDQLPTCSAPVWRTCELIFPLSPDEDNSRTELRAEFRSPHRDTLAIQGFRQAPGRWVIRVAPNEIGQWDYRITTSVDRLDGRVGHVTGTESDAPGFVQTALLHHFQTQGNQLQHLWMGAEVENFLQVTPEQFAAVLKARREQGFTHLRVVIDKDSDLDAAAERIRAINDQGFVADLVLPVPEGSRRQRERDVAELVARFGAFNVTWAGIPAFETIPEEIGDGWELARGVSEAIAASDPYHHPLTSMAQMTSASLLGDPNDPEVPMTMLSYGTVDPNVGAVEHQFYHLPGLNMAMASRADLWNATMNGQYPEATIEWPGKEQEMRAWADLMGEARYWNLEPYFDLDGGRALAYPALEYIVYVPKPGPVELHVEKHGYDVLWMDPATGERIDGDGFNDEVFSAEPPPGDHDWVLRVSREGKKKDLLGSYKFDALVPSVQQVETRASETPYEVALPKGDLSLRVANFYELKVTRGSLATRDLLVEWTVELASGRGGFRVVGTGQSGQLRLPKILTEQGPGVLSLRVQLLNKFGKAYSVDRAIRLTE